MKKYTNNNLIINLIVFMLFISTIHCTSIGNVELDVMVAYTTSSSCKGTIGECLDEEELEVDSESNRRILANRRRYISYGALRRNYVPCSRRGASYYNCRPGASANPYRRGCSRIARCKR